MFNRKTKTITEDEVEAAREMAKTGSVEINKVQKRGKEPRAKSGEERSSSYVP